MDPALRNQFLRLLNLSPNSKAPPSPTGGITIPELGESSNTTNTPLSEESFWTPPTMAYVSSSRRHQEASEEEESRNKAAAATYETYWTLLECMKVKRIEENPFKRSGPSLPASVWEVEGEGFVRVRVDMPGVNSVLVYQDPHENSINFRGLEEEITMHGIDKDGRNCRSYEGSLHFDRDRFPGLDFDYEFANGVLFFKINCLIPATTAAELGVLLMRKQTDEEQLMKNSAHNPLVSSGKDRHCIQGNKDEGYVFGFDTPGLGEEDLIMTVVTESRTNSMISFFLEEKNPRPYGESDEEQTRVYEGTIMVDPNEFDAKKTQYEINHGVFWIQVPHTVKPLPSAPITVFPTATARMEKRHG